MTGRIVVLCGSLRHLEQFDIHERYLVMQGDTPISICKAFNEHLVAKEPRMKAALDALHKRKIALCNEVLVINPDGYIGESTRSEIEYAESLGKPVGYLLRPAARQPDHQTMRVDNMQYENTAAETPETRPQRTMADREEQ